MINTYTQIFDDESLDLVGMPIIDQSDIDAWAQSRPRCSMTSSAFSWQGAPSSTGESLKKKANSKEQKPFNGLQPAFNQLNHIYVVGAEQNEKDRNKRDALKRCISMKSPKNA